MRSNPPQSDPREERLSPELAQRFIHCLRAEAWVEYPDDDPGPRTLGELAPLLAGYSPRVLLDGKDVMMAAAASYRRVLGRWASDVYDSAIPREEADLSLAQVFDRHRDVAIVDLTDTDSAGQSPLHAMLGMALDPNELRAIHLEVRRRCESYAELREYLFARGDITAPLLGASLFEILAYTESEGRDGKAMPSMDWAIPFAIESDAAKTPGQKGFSPIEFGLVNARILNKALVCDWYDQPALWAHATSQGVGHYVARQVGMTAPRGVESAAIDRCIALLTEMNRRGLLPTGESSPFNALWVADEIPDAWQSPQQSHQLTYPALWYLQKTRFCSHLGLKYPDAIPALTQKTAAELARIIDMLSLQSSNMAKDGPSWLIAEDLFRQSLMDLEGIRLAREVDSRHTAFAGTLDEEDSHALPPTL